MMSFISRVFFKGLITLIPITLTISLIMWIVSKAEGAFSDPLRQVLPIYIPGFSVILALILIFIAGLAVNNYLTNRFVAWVENKVERMPIVKSIYSPIRDVTHLFAKSDTPSQHQRVVMVSFGNGIESMGLITRDKFTDLPVNAVPENHAAVFLPFSYGVGGFTVIVEKSRLRETSLTAEKAMQLSITGWIKA